MSNMFFKLNFSEIDFRERNVPKAQQSQKHHINNMAAFHPSTCQQFRLVPICPEFCEVKHETGCKGLNHKYMLPQGQLAYGLYHICGCCAVQDEKALPIQPGGYGKTMYAGKSLQDVLKEVEKQVAAKK